MYHDRYWCVVFRSCNVFGFGIKMMLTLKNLWKIGHFEYYNVAVLEIRISLIPSVAALTVVCMLTGFSELIL